MGATTFGPDRQPSTRGKGPSKGAKYKRKASQLLLDLRWAYEHVDDNATPGRPQQARFRTMFQENSKGFLELWRKEEQVHRDGEKKKEKEDEEPEEVPEDVDQGLDRVMGLLGEEWKRVEGALRYLREQRVQGVAGQEGAAEQAEAGSNR